MYLEKYTCPFTLLLQTAIHKFVVVNYMWVGLSSFAPTKPLVKCTFKSLKHGIATHLILFYVFLPFFLL